MHIVNTGRISSSGPGTSNFRTLVAFLMGANLLFLLFYPLRNSSKLINTFFRDDDEPPYFTIGALHTTEIFERIILLHNFQFILTAQFTYFFKGTCEVSPNFVVCTYILNRSVVSIHALIFVNEVDSTNDRMYNNGPFSW